MSSVGAKSRLVSDGTEHGLAFLFVCLLVACLTSQQCASVSQGLICLGNRTEIEVGDQMC